MGKTIIPIESKLKTLILEIKGNSLDDGPGIRTVVFFKGCPLSCIWCHNPESKSSDAELSFDRNECVGCGACESACPEEAIDRTRPYPVNRGKCTLCFRCCDVCPSQALSPVGSAMTAQQIITIIERDIPFYNTSGGGVTLSGGEPALYMDFVSHLLRPLKDRKIHTIIETCGFFNNRRFMDLVYPYLDAVYMDLKLFDREDHRRYCGVPNDAILDNFRNLHELYLNGGIEVLPRIPLVPGITATGENLRDLVGFLKNCNASRVALLPYNPLWPAKSDKIGAGNAMPSGECMKGWMPAAEVKRCEAIFDGFEIVR